MTELSLNKIIWHFNPGFTNVGDCTDTLVDEGTLKCAEYDVGYYRISVDLILGEKLY